MSSEAFIKSVTNISDNVAGQYLLPSLREAQEIRLQAIIGTALLDKLKSLQADGTLEASENAQYLALVERMQYYLAYTTVAMLVEKMTYKITNFGVVKSADENLQVASAVEVSNTKEYYQGKADFYAYRLQGFLIENRRDYPELSECQCNKIRSHLYTASTCGIFLGGARGKGIGGGCCR